MDNYNNIPNVTHPSNMKIRLFKHQLWSIYNMEKLELEQKIEYENYIKYTKIGINADIAGYGKTYSMLGLIIRDKMNWDINTPYIFEKTVNESNGLIIKTTIERYEKLPSTLILTSPSIINQWKKEIENTNLSVIIISTRKNIDDIDVKCYDIILVTPSMYNDLIRSYSRYAWKRFIFDEPGHTRVSSMKEIKAGFYWFVTSTPNLIKSYHQSCKGSMMNNIISNSPCDTIEKQFEGMIIRNNPEFVKLSFSMPTTIYKNYYCFQPIFKTISGIANPLICKMIDTGNIEGAISALGGNKTKNIIELVKLKKIEELEQIKSKIIIYTIRENEERLIYYKELEKKIYQQIKELEDKFNQMLQENCHICLCNMKNIVMEPSCQNVFCGDCLLKWLKIHNKCPLCRLEVNFNELIYINTENEDVKDISNLKTMTKTEQIIDIIKSKQHGKFIVFSDYEGSFLSISNILEENEIKFMLLKGNSNNRSDIINKYKSGDINVIFLNSKYDSAGINLQETTDIILYHEICTSTKNQIICRAERIGRSSELYIHQLYSSQ